MRIRPAFLNSTEGNVDSLTVVGMFKDAVFQLTTSPGNVAEYLKPIVDTLKGGVNDPDVISEIIEVLLEQVGINKFRTQLNLQNSIAPSQDPDQPLQPYSQISVVIVSSWWQQRQKCVDEKVHLNRC